MKRIEFVRSVGSQILIQAPFFFFAVLLIVGIVVYPAIIPHISTLALCGATAALAICFACSYIWKPSIKIFIVSLFFISLGASLREIHLQRYAPLLEDDYFIGRISAPIIEKKKTLRTEISYGSFPKHKAILYIEKDSSTASIRYGDMVECKGDFKIIEHDSSQQFNFKNYAAQQYIYTQAYIRAKDISVVWHKSCLLTKSYELQQYFVKKFQNSHLDKNHAHLVSALVFGNKSMLDSEIIAHFSTAGIMHILAVSGLHVGIISAILFFLFKFLPRRISIIRIVLILVCLWSYACIVGLSASVCRAASMLSILLLSQELNTKSSTYNSLGISAFIMLCIQPQVVYNAGFQLSYLAVIGIVYFATIIQNSLQFKNNLISTYAWGIIAVSISVLITTLPISMFYFGYIPSYSILANVYSIPAAFVLLASVVVFICVGSLPLVSDALLWIIDTVSHFIITISKSIAHFPYASIDIHYSTSALVATYSAIFILVVAREYYKFLRIEKHIIW